MSLPRLDLDLQFTAEGSAAEVPERVERERRELVEEGREIQRANFDCPMTGSCLYEAVGLIAAAQRRGRKLHLVAGSALWPRVYPWQDDGVSPTHFGYQWEPKNPVTASRVALGLMPEMHIWAVDPETREYIDSTARHFPDQARRIAGLIWHGPEPPDFLWAPIDALPRGVVYEADTAASSLAARMIEEEIRRRQ